MCVYVCARERERRGREVDMTRARDVYVEQCQNEARAAHPEYSLYSPPSTRPLGVERILFFTLSYSLLSLFAFYPTALYTWLV